MAHVEEKIKPHEKPALLLDAVMTKTPSEVAKLYKSLGRVDFTANALGFACRYRGLEMVKVLVDGGAKFFYDFNKVRLLGLKAGVCFVDKPDHNFSEAILRRFKTEMIDHYRGEWLKTAVLPLNERLKILNYLCGNAGKAGFDMNELLFLSYFSDECEIRDLLKSYGAVIPEGWAELAVTGSFGGWSNDKWLYDYCDMVEFMEDKYLIPNINALRTALEGQKLHFTEKLWNIALEKRQSIPGFYNFLVESFDLSKANKSKMMKSIIEKDSTEGLAAVAELGWLKQPKKRDEMIAYSTEKGKTECTAWLLDFKNRTADLAAELERTEKKQERELNAAPDSAIMLKQFWSFKKKEDGTIIITGYKGDKTEITVPEKIGKSIVTEIGERAFSPNAPRITEKQAVVRCRITKITVPPSVKVIGAEAFGGSGVCKGNFNAFSLLEEVILPGSLDVFASKTSAENSPIIFINCKKLTVKIPHSPYAEIFCRKNKVNYFFKEENNNG